MNSTQCFRLCRSCLTQASRALAAEPSVVWLPRVRGGSASISRRHPGAAALQQRSLSTPTRDSEPPVAAAAPDADDAIHQDGLDLVDPDLDDSEAMSQFRRQRLDTLEKDRNSEDPVFEESYPRLEHRENPISVPRFRRIHVNTNEVLDGNIVTVYGMRNCLIACLQAI